MFPAASLLTTLLLALSVIATPLQIRTPLVNLELAKRVHAGGGGKNLVQHDRARATALKERSVATQSKLNRRATSIPVTNRAVSYVAAIGVGSPATTYNLIVDTGSSNTWVGAGTPYHQTSTSEDTGQPVSVMYGSGIFSGEEWTDTVTFGPGFDITKQSIGVASTSTGFAGVDGILGVGPEGLTKGTLTTEPDTEISTVTQNLYAQGKIPEQVIGVFFAPTTTDNSTNGQLTFGGTDRTKYIGTLTYAPLTTVHPAAEYWGINQSITYGTTTILAETAGVVDTGTTLLLIASDAYSAYQSVTGATYDPTTATLRFTPAQYDKLQNLNFHIGSVTYALTPNAQIWPRSLNTYIGGTSGAIYGIVGDAGSLSGEGLDFINGQVFLERFYSVFDTANSRVGFARTAYTDATTN